MKYALIGCGRVSGCHLKAARDNNLNIVGICDISEENMLENLSSLGIADLEKYSDYKKLISEKKPELVAIAVHSGLHAEIALYCINAGCNVIIEKPIALSIEDADKIIEAGKKMNVKVCTCHQNRFNKAIQGVRKAIDDGKLGRLLYGVANIHWSRDDDYYKQASWRGTWADDGGTLMNQCIHNIDLLKWMMSSDVSEVTGVTARLNHSIIEAEDFGAALVKFKSGAYGIIDGTINAYKSDFEETLTIFGETGTVKVGGTHLNKIDYWMTEGMIEEEHGDIDGFFEKAPSIYGLGHTAVYADMCDAIKNNRAPYITAEDGKKALEIVLSVYKSAAEGKAAILPLEKCSTMDFCGRFD